MRTPGRAKTASPGLNFETPHPPVRGIDGGRVASDSTSSGPGTGVGTSAKRSTSGPPYFSYHCLHHTLPKFTSQRLTSTRRVAVVVACGRCSDGLTTLFTSDIMPPRMFCGIEAHSAHGSVAVGSGCAGRARSSRSASPSRGSLAPEAARELMRERAAL
jgi:hypothetical protein